MQYMIQPTFHLCGVTGMCGPLLIACTQHCFVSSINHTPGKGIRLVPRPLWGVRMPISLLQLFSVYIERHTYKYHISIYRCPVSGLHGEEVRGGSDESPPMPKLIALGGPLTPLAIEEPLLLSKQFCCYSPQHNTNSMHKDSRVWVWL